MPRSKLLSPSAFVRRAGVYKGVLGGQRGWLIAGGVFWGFRSIRKMFGRNEEVAATEKLKPGQFVTIQAIRPETRSDRRRARRASAG